MSKPPRQRNEYSQDSACEQDRHSFGCGDAGQGSRKASATSTVPIPPIPIGMRATRIDNGTATTKQTIPT